MTLNVREAEERAKEARARAEKATLGPWAPDHTEAGDVVVWGPEEDWLANVGNWARQNPEATLEMQSLQYVQMRDAADGEFIAAARSDVPALCDDVEALADLARRLSWGRQDHLIDSGSDEQTDALLIECREAGLLEETAMTFDAEMES